jgi:hypothetical protein
MQQGFKIMKNLKAKRTCASRGGQYGLLERGALFSTGTRLGTALPWLNSLSKLMPMRGVDQF